MTNDIKDWSTTPASNDIADPGINWQEGMAPSAVNNSARGMMAAVKSWWDESLGGTSTYSADTGAADAYTIAPSPVITAYAAGQNYVFFAANANTGASTLNVNALGTKAIQKNGSALASGDIGTGDLVAVVYDGTQFQLVNNPRFNTFSTLAVTGDLTVDTSTLHVDSTNNRVGVGTATPDADLEINFGGASSTLKLATTGTAQTTQIQLYNEEGGAGVQAWAIQNRASELDRLAFRDLTAGAVLGYFEPNGGLVVGAPVGANKGLGTINASGVYDDNTLLTCYPADAAIDGTIDLGVWNDLSNTAEHKPAARFKARMARDLDPGAFYSDFTSRRALPAFPTREEWTADGPLSTGDIIQRLWETVEVQTVHINKLLERISALEGA